MKIMASSPIPSWQIDWGNNENSDSLYFPVLQNHCRWWLQPWNEKTFAPWKKSYDQPRQLIKKQRHQLEIELPYDPAVPLLGIQTEETRIERDTCTPMFIAALFTIARAWTQPRCTLADEWIRKLWYIYGMEYYPAIKKNTFESALMRMKLEPYYTEWSKPER